MANMRYGIPGMHVLFPSGIFRKCTSAQWLWHQRTSQFCFTKAKAGKRRDADIWEDSKIKKLILPFFSLNKGQGLVQMLNPNITNMFADILYIFCFKHLIPPYS